MAPKNILLEGKPGIGKTTLIHSIADQLAFFGVGGFYTREIREQQRRGGFRVETFQGGSGVLAHVAFTAGPTVGKYRVDVDTFERIGVQALERALLNEAIRSPEHAPPAISEKPGCASVQDSSTTTDIWQNVIPAGGYSSEAQPTKSRSERDSAHDPPATGETCLNVIPAQAGCASGCHPPPEAGIQDFEGRKRALTPDSPSNGNSHETIIPESRIILIDEIGKMERFSERFKEVVLACLDSNKPVIATIMSGSHPFVDEVKNRGDVELVRVTLENRDQLMGAIVREIGE
ncbi:MAG TPA: nucleoside-triphosphatase [Thermodesulfobacteriota bacterium]|nr:nucleoside-triphosphatase [Thermodesulfobacteriota bacterium]